MNKRRNRFEGGLLWLLMFFVWLPALLYWKEAVDNSSGTQELLNYAAMVLTSCAMLAVMMIVSSAIDDRDSMERRIEEYAKNWQWITETNDSLVKQLDLEKQSRHHRSE